jgi:hypothetical protein
MFERIPISLMNLPYRHALSALLLLSFAPVSAFAATNTNVHTTWLWHLHQPIYWLDRAPANHAADHYQNAWDTIQLGNTHPNDTVLTTVFGAGDRIAAYQGGHAGAQLPDPVCDAIGRDMEQSAGDEFCRAAADEL